MIQLSPYLTQPYQLAKISDKLISNIFVAMGRLEHFGLVEPYEKDLGAKRLIKEGRNVI